MTEISTDFKRKGFAAGVEILTPTELKAFLAAFEEMLDQERTDLASPGFRLHDTHLNTDFVWEVATHPRVLSVLHDITGERELVMLNSKFICKTPGSTKIVPWHCDATFAGLEPADQVIVWLALDDTDDGNGCLRFLPSSVIPYGSREHVVPTAAGGTHVDQQLPVTPAEEEQAFSVHVQAGSAVAFDGRMVHSSRSTSATRRRYALALRYIGGNVRQLNCRQWAAVQVSGGNSLVDDTWVFTRESARNFTYAPPNKFGGSAM